MESSLQYYMQLMHSDDINSSIFAVVIGVFFIIFTAVLWRLLSGKRQRKNGILLVGCSDAGKTLLFCQLVTGKRHDTQTSFQENKASYEVEHKNKKASFTLYDLPGHESIRYKYLEDFKHNARAIIFVVDSATFQANQKDVAEFLFRIFTDKSIAKSSPAICVACNKQDLLLAKSKRVIHAKLEDELNTLRKTQSAALESTDGSDNSSVYLGIKGKDFQFDQLTKFQIEFVECNTAASEEVPSVNVDELKSWISSLV